MPSRRKRILFKNPPRRKRSTTSAMLKRYFRKERSRNKWLYTYDKSKLP